MGSYGLEGEALYRAMFAQLAESVSVYEMVRDSDGVIVDWVLVDLNEKAESNLGAAREDVLGQTALGMFGPEVMEEYLSVCKALDGTQEVHRFETEFAHDRRCYHSSVFFLTSELYVVVSVDTTDRRRAEAEKLALQERLLNAQKMKALGTLASGVAHDFNNVLQPIIGHLDLLLENEALDQEVVDDLQVVLDGALQARALTERILTFARPASVDAGADPRVVVRETLQMLRKSLPEGVCVEAELDPGCGKVSASASTLHRVVMNLVVNAGQALAPSGGVIGVRLEAMSNGWARLVVTDDGPGMPAEVLRHVFDPFFTTKQEGTGLGLAVVQGLVVDVGGKLDLESQPEQGTTFVVEFPPERT